MEFPTKTRESKSIFTIASPAEDRKSSSSGVRAGAKAAAVACVASAIPTLIAVRKIPWAKANINHTGQALIVSAASIAAFFVTADKTVLQSARKNSHFERTT
ncbi:early nodulin-93-like isoform X2 [Mangifera indica]|uniref:early nodulin-93-like isoform X2 n=1 Tax=Mangifera indica TaxID=29780 RepID=UPI001CF98E33|nr:early nodulin-93-like isoform X2 [Mangifera indica]